MEMRTLKCPQCDAMLEVDNGLDTFYCQYCGAKIILEGQSKDIVNAKVKLKELEHKRIEKKMEYDHELRVKEWERRKEIEDDKSEVLGWIGMIVIVIILFLIFGR